MKIDSDGKINHFDRKSLEVMNEFSFDMEAMSDEILQLRADKEEHDKTCGL